MSCALVSCFSISPAVRAFGVSGALAQGLGEVPQILPFNSILCRFPKIGVLVGGGGGGAGGPRMKTTHFLCVFFSEYPLHEEYPLSGITSSSGRPSVRGKRAFFFVFCWGGGGGGGGV